MEVGIDEAWRNDMTRSIDYACPSDLIPGDRGNPPAFHTHIRHLVKAGLGIHDSPIGDHEVKRSSIGLRLDRRGADCRHGRSGTHVFCEFATSQQAAVGILSVVIICLGMSSVFMEIICRHECRGRMDFLGQLGNTLIMISPVGCGFVKMTRSQQHSVSSFVAAVCSHFTILPAI